MPKPIKTEQYLTDRQVADRWGVGLNTVKRRRREGSLAFLRMGPHPTSPVRIPLSAVLAYEAAQAGGAA